MSPLYEIYLKHRSISTDTRRIIPDSIFVALRGASFDGNRFAAEALEKGAAYAVVDDPAVAVDARYIVVENTLQALQALAREHRRALQIPILAIAGSNGKTTTKELVSRVVAQKYRIYATRGNLNNHIGVPLTLLAMGDEVEFGIVEMGASACGEIALLCSIAEPNYGLLTNVGRAHLEGFGGVEGVRRGKGELYDYLNATGGTALLREEDDTLTSMAEERPTLKRIAYTTSLADGIRHHLEGEYNRYNVAAAAAVGRFLEIEPAKIAAAIDSYHPDNNRSQREERATNTLIVDCYNANPSSMQLAVENMAKEKLENRSKKVLILGDMRELGAWSEEEHRTLIGQASKIDSARLIFVGEEFRKALATMVGIQAEHHADCTALRASLQEVPIRDALVLIKGSRGIGLERILELL
ncbi:MAG: UDP-N-acetylmuramoyl-tripeptide--D-alanyl-D-alanine ligase [Rikenellaceae bacterium]|nr:UDP-N-acetylmuramoyl-tripeptide--D-alanyl-D-alanine ligase [Rikenellaceae bacterium]